MYFLFSLLKTVMLLERTGKSTLLTAIQIVLQKYYFVLWECLNGNSLFITYFDDFLFLRKVIQQITWSILYPHILCLCISGENKGPGLHE